MHNELNTRAVVEASPMVNSPTLMRIMVRLILANYQREARLFRRAMDETPSAAWAKFAGHYTSRKHSNKNKASMARVRKHICKSSSVWPPVIPDHIAGNSPKFSGDLSKLVLQKGGDQ